MAGVLHDVGRNLRDRGLVGRLYETARIDGAYTAAVDDVRLGGHRAVEHADRARWWRHVVRRVLDVIHDHDMTAGQMKPLARGREFLDDETMALETKVDVGERGARLRLRAGPQPDMNVH